MGLRDYLKRYELLIGAVALVALLGLSWHIRGRVDEAAKIEAVAAGRAAAWAMATEEAAKNTQIAEAGHGAFKTAVASGCPDNARLLNSMWARRLRASQAKIVATCPQLGHTASGEGKDLQPALRGELGRSAIGAVGSINLDADITRALVLQCAAWGEECVAKGVCEGR